eukprot:scaffold314068_cov33-Tisochrysis_lutea.AAC.1
MMSRTQPDDVRGCGLRAQGKTARVAAWRTTRLRAQGKAARTVAWWTTRLRAARRRTTRATRSALPVAVGPNLAS